MYKRKRCDAYVRKNYVGMLNMLRGMVIYLSCDFREIDGPNEVTITETVTAWLNGGYHDTRCCSCLNEKGLNARHGRNQHDPNHTAGRSRCSYDRWSITPNKAVVSLVDIPETGSQAESLSCEQGPHPSSREKDSSNMQSGNDKHHRRF